MKNRGYTLIELLGVIVILALLTTLVFPSVINTIKKSNKELDENALKLVSTSADIYIKNNKELFPRKNGNKFSIDVNKLIDNANLSSKIKLSSGDKIEDKCIQTTYKNGKFTYEIKDKGTCINEEFFTCRPVDENTVTDGNIPSGQFNDGDEYICEVKDNTFYHFFVIGQENDTVSLIMDRNMCEDGTAAVANSDCTTMWTDSTDSSRIAQGPVIAMAYLNKATSSWKNIDDLNKVYTAPAGGLKNFLITGKSRLLYEKEYTASTYLYTNLSHDDWDSRWTSITKPSSSMAGIWGYWVLDCDSTYYDAYFIYNGGYIINPGVTTKIGVRPVIEVNKEFFARDKYFCELQSGYISNTVGAKYSCDFGDGTRNFYILELGSNPVSNSKLKSNEVALILEGNYEDIALTWCDSNGPNPSDNICNADGLTPTLNKIASNWKDLKKNQIVLPSVEQVLEADNKNFDQNQMIFNLSKEWLYNWPYNNDDNNGYDMSAGYWTSTPHVHEQLAWRVINTSEVSGGFIDEDDSFGVRPVVILSTSELE